MTSEQEGMANRIAKRAWSGAIPIEIDASSPSPSVTAAPPPRLDRELDGSFRKSSRQLLHGAASPDFLEDSNLVL